MNVYVLCLTIVTILSVRMWSGVEPCNEAVCASIVSKCMLTQSCKCDDFKQNRTCSKDCYHCLDYLYHDCCSCVEMCPKPNSNDSSLASKSHVEELPEPQHDLFTVLTEEKDHLLRWTSYSTPLKVVIMESIGSLPHKEVTKTEGSDGVDVEKDIAVNCTVAYMSQCMSWNKCKSSCTSMGASSYRWFHDGCCECVGLYCINYGMNESKCLQCPLTPEDDYISGNAMPTEEHDSNGGTDDRIVDYDVEEEDDQRSQNALHSSDKQVIDKNDKQIIEKKSNQDLNEQKKESL